MPSDGVTTVPFDASRQFGNEWDAVRDGRVFVTGGSGFFGQVFLERMIAANRHRDSQIQAVVLTRDAKRFRQRLPQFASESCIGVHVGDVRSVVMPTESFTHLIHLADEPHGPRYATDPDGMVSAMIAGAKRVLEIARGTGIRRVLLVSSGAIYGPQPDYEWIPEDAQPNPEPTPSRRAYAYGKQTVEELFLAATNLEVIIARPFAFLGRGLPRDAVFAASQFLNQAQAGGPIIVLHGNVTRSYLDSSNLAEWLWTLLLRGVSGQSYNVGSEHPVTMAKLARLIAAEFQPTPGVNILADGPNERYVPSTRKARETLGLTETVGIKEAIRATIAWHREAANAAQHSR